ncbi:hypothetical protein BDN70DRAFT_482040 [Pholiota conissans]|uniref:Uncharacterized protein n=1 Tax=Pholiota conissans TaxID=109636 RepID=A0A9P5YMA4_9AGAR|nr:hypothetical protein BDN70DRAFT_482040 [Pholiota conissans]
MLRDGKDLTVVTRLSCAEPLLSGDQYLFARSLEAGSTVALTALTPSAASTMLSSTRPARSSHAHPPSTSSQILALVIFSIIFYRPHRPFITHCHQPIRVVVHRRPGRRLSIPYKHSSETPHHRHGYMPVISAHHPTWTMHTIPWGGI